jgi:predicted MFS family arabinose efflux permease
MILCGVALIMVNIPISTYRYKIVESDKLAKVNSLMVIGTQGLMPIASFVGGIIIQALGIGYLLSFCALGLLITSILLASSKTVRAI